jgi:hypothetical protein
MINLLIAMMAQSFENVYDINQRVARMERAKAVSEMEIYTANRVVRAGSGWRKYISMQLILGAGTKYVDYAKKAVLEQFCTEHQQGEQDENMEQIKASRQEILNSVRENANRLEQMEGMLDALAAQIDSGSAAAAAAEATATDTRGGRRPRRRLPTVVRPNSPPANPSGQGEGNAQRPTRRASTNA